jgi:hypothetical protein
VLGIVCAKPLRSKWQGSSRDSRSVIAIAVKEHTERDEPIMSVQPPRWKTRAADRELVWEPNGGL